ncbi:MAG TPA: hypothetical protein VF444_05495 [Pseudonocardiaceae bacterium]
MAEQPNTGQFNNTDQFETQHFDVENTPKPQRPVRRGGPDPLALLAGLATLCVAAYLLFDGALWLPPVDPRWVIAGAALLGGLLLLVLSLRPGRRR